MKMRNGFVSNSSSSSFIIAIRKQEKNNINNIKLIEFLSKHTEKRPLWKDELAVSAREEILNSELQEMSNDLIFLIKEKAIWSKLAKNRNFDKFLGKVKERINKINNYESVRNLRFMEENAFEHKVCKTVLNKIIYFIKEITKEMIKIEKILAKLKRLDDNWLTFSFEEDSNWGNKVVSSIVRDLEKQKKAIILYEYHS